MSNRSQETLYHALFMAQHFSKCDLLDGLVYILLELQMPQHRIGYFYVRTAIMLFYKDPVHMLTTGIYQVVGERLNPNADYGNMENAMREVIGKAYAECDPKTWSYYFRERRKGKKSPANLEFVSQVSAFMELWQACCKEVSYEIL